MTRNSGNESDLPSHLEGFAGPPGETDEQHESDVSDSQLLLGLSPLFSSLGLKRWQRESA